MLRNVVRTTESDRGAVLIYTALTMPVLLIFGAIAVGITSLWTGHHDVQRSVDLAALAGAANTPTVSSDLPISGTVRIHDLSVPLDPTDWGQRPCEVVSRQLNVDVNEGRSIVATAYSDGEAPTCEATWLFESQLLATLAYCVEHNRDDLQGCRDQLEDELRTSLPLINDLDASAMSAIKAVHDLLPDPAAKLLGSTLRDQLGNACAKEIGTSILGISSWSCVARVKHVLAPINHQTGELQSQVSALLLPIITKLQNAAQNQLLDPLSKLGIGLDVEARPRMPIRPQDVAPALLTPRVRVDVGDLDMRPPLSPLSFDVEGTATARRVIKSALVLPTLGIPGIPATAWNTLPPKTQNALRTHLGPDAMGKLDRAAQRAGFVINDPNMLNRYARDVAQRGLTFFDQSEVTLSSAVSGALCTSLTKLTVPLTCPVGDDYVDRDHLFGPFIEDVADATRPAPQGTEPTLEEVLGYYADAEEPLWLVAPLAAWLPELTFGEELFETLEHPKAALQNPSVKPLLNDPLLPEWDPTTPPNLGYLFSPLMFIPAMDVVPAAIFRDGDTFRIERVAATTGLYKARLVK